MITTNGQMCESWCGGGIVGICTKVKHDRALRVSKETAKKLGAGWKPNLAHNLGWYAGVISSCGRLSVSVYAEGRGTSDYRRGVKLSYHAWLHERGDSGSQWPGVGKTPQEAIRRTVAAAEDAHRRITKLLDRIPRV